MSDNAMWPNPDKPGVPLNPERHGWHWLLWEGQYPTGNPEVHYYSASLPGGWPEFDHKFPPPGWRYLAPCLTSAEVAQRERDAELRGRRAAEAEVSVQIDTAIQHEREKLDRELFGFNEAITVLARKANEPELTILAVRRLWVELIQRMQDAAQPDGMAMRVELTQKERDAHFRNQLIAAADRALSRANERTGTLPSRGMAP